MKKLMIVILVVLGTNMYAQITSQTIKETRIELLKKAPNFHFQGNIMVQTITLGDNGPEFVKEIETAINEIAKMTEKLVFLSEDHRKAVRKYMKLCQKENVVPLPILNKLE
mgnify:CR=1 FL=1